MSQIDPAIDAAQADIAQIEAKRAALREELKAQDQALQARRKEQEEARRRIAEQLGLIVPSPADAVVNRETAPPPGGGGSTIATATASKFTVGALLLVSVLLVANLGVSIARFHRGDGQAPAPAPAPATVLSAADRQKAIEHGRELPRLFGASLIRAGQEVVGGATDLNQIKQEHEQRWAEQRSAAFDQRFVPVLDAIFPGDDLSTMTPDQRRRYGETLMAIGQAIQESTP